MNKYGFLFFGALFGFMLSRGGATTYDFYARLFLMGPGVETDIGTVTWHPQLLLVIGVAVAVSAPLYKLLQWRKAKAVMTGETLDYTGKPWRKTLIGGSLLMGLGWGLAGACPGTSLVMVGEGKMPALVVIVGIIFGTWLFGWQASRKMQLATDAEVGGDVPAGSEGKSENASTPVESAKK